MRKRYSHTIQPSRGATYPRRIVVIDCDSRSSRIASNTIIEREEMYSWTSHATILKNGNVISSYTSNGTSAFDFWAKLDRWLDVGEQVWMVTYQASRVLSLLGFWDQLEEGGIILEGDDDWTKEEEHKEREEWNRGLCVIEDPPIIILCRRKGHRGLLKIIDIRNYGISEPCKCKMAKERADMIDHVFLRMIGTLQQHDLGSLRETAGSQGIIALRHRFLDPGILVHTYTDALKLERASYHGGRCECFQLGQLKTQAYMVDVNSMYPWVCQTSFLPVYPLNRTDTDCEQEINLDDRHLLYIADVTLSTSKPDYPVSVIFDRENRMRQYRYWDEIYDQRNRPQTVYPVGTFRTALAGPEFLDAYRHGRVKEIHSITTYHGDMILANWSSCLYGIMRDFKKEGNKALAQWAKSMLVSGIGKFGATYHQWVSSTDVPAYEPYHQWIYTDKDGMLTRYRSIAWHVQKEETAPNGTESVPSIASYVTSLARVRLLHLIRTVGYNHVFYCDTDALIVDQEGYDLLRLLGEMDETRIGYLKTVSEDVDTEILGIKHYRIGGKMAMAGIPRRSDGEVPQSMKVWEWDHPTEAISHGCKPQPRKRLTEYKFRGRYHHGYVAKDGKVSPLIMGSIPNERKIV